MADLNITADDKTLIRPVYVTCHALWASD